MLLRTINAISRWLHAIGAYVVLPLLTLLISVDVVLRYVFSAPLSWSLEVSKYLLLIMILLGLLASFRDDVHIRVDIFHSLLPRPAKRVVGLAMYFCVAFIFMLIALKATEEARFAFRVGLKSPQLELPTWPPLALVAFACWGMTAYGVLTGLGALLGRIPVDSIPDTSSAEAD